MFGVSFQRVSGGRHTDTRKKEYVPQHLIAEFGLSVVSIWARYNLECPDCGGKLEDWNVHIHIARAY